MPRTRTVFSSRGKSCMSDNVLIDTNIRVYFHALNPQAKREKAQQLIDRNFQNIAVSSQILSELYPVLGSR